MVTSSANVPRLFLSDRRVSIRYRLLIVSVISTALAFAKTAGAPPMAGFSRLAIWLTNSLTRLNRGLKSLLAVRPLGGRPVSNRRSIPEPPR